MTIAKLLEEEVEPPREWKWMFVWAAGISFFPDVRTRVRRHIESEGAKALEIYGDRRRGRKRVLMRRSSLWRKKKKQAGEIQEQGIREPARSEAQERRGLQ